MSDSGINYFARGGCLGRLVWLGVALLAGLFTLQGVPVLARVLPIPYAMIAGLVAGLVIALTALVRALSGVDEYWHLEANALYRDGRGLLFRRRQIYLYRDIMDWKIIRRAQEYGPDYYVIKVKTRRQGWITLPAQATPKAAEALLALIKDRSDADLAASRL